MSSVPRYEEEVALRATSENEFVALKKVSDSELVILQPELVFNTGHWRPLLPRASDPTPA